MGADLPFIEWLGCALAGKRCVKLLTGCEQRASSTVKADGANKTKGVRANAKVSMLNPCPEVAQGHPQN